MAEMTKDMYGAIGKFGNKVFYQRGGKTIARTITRPKNPKTGPSPCIVSLSKR